MSIKVRCHWHLLWQMVEAKLFAITVLVPLQAERGVTLSREQVYRLVAQVPERLSLAMLAALCVIMGCSPGDLIETRPGPGRRIGGGSAAMAQECQDPPGRRPVIASPNS